MPDDQEELEILLLSPLEIHFSQLRIRYEFQDNHTVEESTAAIKTTQATVAGAVSDAEKEGAAAAPRPSASEANGAGTFVELLPPFPRIEVTRWRCKLREPDGSPKLDPVSGLELYSHEERWFTFDNRRLYCLQKAAVAQWPNEVRVEVLEIPSNLARTRELRKFDTRTFGCSVLVGRREDPEPLSWCWRTEVGLPRELQPEDGVGKQKSLRRRGNWNQGRGGRRGPNSGRRNSGTEENTTRQTCLEVFRSVLLFFLIYLGLRVGVSMFRRYAAGPSPVTDLPEPGS